MDSGQVWFLEVLLLFSILYMAWRGMTRHRARSDEKPGKLPSTPAIAGFIIALGLLSFMVRLRQFIMNLLWTSNRRHGLADARRRRRSHAVTLPGQAH